MIVYTKEGFEKDMITEAINLLNIGVYIQLEVYYDTQFIVILITK
jgi:hypothetical protein